MAMMADGEPRRPFRLRMTACLALAALAADAAACGSEVSPNAGQGDGAGGGSGAAPGGPLASSGGTKGCDDDGTGGFASAESCLAFGTPVAVGRAEEPALSALSGLVASRTQPGVLFAHADHNGPGFFAIDKAGHTLAAFGLAGAFAADLEDVALGPGPDSCSWLYLGDIGDNAARPGTGAGRSEIQVFRLVEPTVSLSPTGSVTAVSVWEQLRFAYPDRPHDAETLMVDPTNGDILIVTREQDGSAVVFRAPGATTPATPVVLESLTSLTVGSLGANAGDLAPQGDRALIRTYQAALLFSRSTGTSWAEAFASAPIELPVADETQSEGATFGADGLSWLSSGEADPIVYEAVAHCP